MKVKMKKCVNCKTLLSNSSKLCTKCGSKDLEKGIYTDESNNSIIYNKHLPKIEIRRCPTCGAGVTMKYGGECSFCGDDISSDGSSFYQDYIDRVIKNECE
ncbi:hypothetical protein V7075_13585 [Neobacillus drentensis]|uniref:hypothetical protein n=1 Tax=Neobacillus drentensis TaxID=220684 RepID=UPI002FFF5604